jgi:carboxynorspermidine decarboxylase
MSQETTPALSAERIAAIRSIPLDEAPSPSFVIHEDLLAQNGRMLAQIAAASGAKILLALKGFASFDCFPIIRPFLAGTTASGLHEALLARDYFGGEQHVYSAAFKTDEIKTLADFAHTLVFNSPGQLQTSRSLLPPGAKIQRGLRINPEHSEGGCTLYDPCAAGSRLGCTREQLNKYLRNASPNFLESIDGLHFHTLCEQDADALERTAQAFETKFGDLLHRMKWVNFGGGHHLTRPGYQIETLCSIVQHFRKRYQLEVYLEPGEAVALHTGLMVATVLDLFENKQQHHAILDCSATCHLPDVLEMPYRPTILDAADADVYPHNYQLGGLSCLAGDSFGSYSFLSPLHVGQRLVFLDMAHYTMVKTNTFNGVPLPAICTFSKQNGLQVKKCFGYEDYRCRLGASSEYRKSPNTLD